MKDITAIRLTFIKALDEDPVNVEIALITMNQALGIDPLKQGCLYKA